MPDSPSGWLRSLAARASVGEWHVEKGFNVVRPDGELVAKTFWITDAPLIALAPDLAVLCADAIDLIAPDAASACDDPECESFSCRAAHLLARFAALQPDNTEEEQT